MAPVVATIEALSQFLTELPAGSPGAERLRRIALSTRAGYESSLTAPAVDTAWFDHNLGVLVAESLEEPTKSTAGRALFLGVRRRLIGALSNEPDDLAPALALARGVEVVTHDERLAADMVAVCRATDSPHCGPRLLWAAVRMVSIGSRSKTEQVRQQASALAPTLAKRLARKPKSVGNHPDVLLGAAALHLLSAQQGDASERLKQLDLTHGLLRDHQQQFGPSAAARDLLGQLIMARARANAPAGDIKEQALSLLREQANEGTLRAREATRLIEAMERSKALDSKTARVVADLVTPLSERDPSAWRKALGRLLKATGENAALMTLWESTLEDKPGDPTATDGLMSALFRNLKGGLDAPFSATVLSLLLEHAPHRSMSRWKPDEVALLVNYLQRASGQQSAATWLRDRALSNHSQRKRRELWNLALSLWLELDPGEHLATAKLAVQHSGHLEARLTVATSLIEVDGSVEALREAEETLRPLMSQKGALGAAAQKLQRKLSNHPEIRAARLHGLETFEKRIGVGTGKAFKLKVIHSAGTYVLVEAFEHAAPDIYEHKHLRTMIRAKDLPDGVQPGHLRKGDVIHAPLRAQNADKQKDRDGLRVYWLADSSKPKLELSKAKLDARLDEEARSYGIGSGVIVELRVTRDAKRGGLQGRIVRRLDGKGTEYPVSIKVDIAQLPEGKSDSWLGKGKRLWGAVEESERSGSGVRSYAVSGQLALSAASTATKETKGSPEGEAPSQSSEPGGQPPSDGTSAPVRVEPEPSAPVPESSSDSTSTSDIDSPAPEERDVQTDEDSA